ncbi:unnamed protein product [Lactuca virosa]|uniref:Uncharacterized protein n=1 Tax=Lactuca virosa TaxID=75947 RepID=A0AAU9PXC9_9ASTR|nr:unnamed protein product [Lactuca virosa]
MQSGMRILIWVFVDSYTPLPPALLLPYSSSVLLLHVGHLLLLVQEWVSDLHTQSVLTSLMKANNNLVSKDG